MAQYGMRPNRPFIVQRSTVYSFADAAEKLCDADVAMSVDPRLSCAISASNKGDPPLPQAGAFRDAATAAPPKMIYGYAEPISWTKRSREALVRD
jgi:hypothetical protein